MADNKSAADGAASKKATDKAAARKAAAGKSAGKKIRVTLVKSSSAPALRIAPRCAAWVCAG
jgi:hypothetical protein